MLYNLYHFPLCPFSRKVRVMLNEKGIDFEMTQEDFWTRREKYAQINPAMQVPAIVYSDGSIIADSYPICEYIEDKFPKDKLIGKSIEEAAEIRRIVSWYDVKFFQDVTKHLLNEKVIKYLKKQGAPESIILRTAKKNMATHLEYISFLTKNKRWLVGDEFSLADIAAGAQISVVDYLNEIPWEQYRGAKEWYQLLKSKPSFRIILKDRVAGFTPPDHYSNPDF